MLLCVYCCLLFSLWYPRLNFSLAYTCLDTLTRFSVHTHTNAQVNYTLSYPRVIFIRAIEDNTINSNMFVCVWSIEDLLSE